MSESFDKKKHSVSLINREELALDGVSDVGAFNEQEVNAVTDWGDILIRGNGLHIEALDLETGVLRINGHISAIVYNDRIVSKGILRRLLS
jgi:sporulation protein YabP